MHFSSAEFYFCLATSHFTTRSLLLILCKHIREVSGLTFLTLLIVFQSPIYMEKQGTQHFGRNLNPKKTFMIKYTNTFFNTNTHTHTHTHTNTKLKFHGEHGTTVCLEHLTQLSTVKKKKNKTIHFTLNR